MKGYETWTKLAQSNGDTAIDGYVQKAMRYDSFGRLACVVYLYPDGGILKEKYTYTFPGEVSQKVTTYKYGSYTDKLEQSYSYDVRGRLKTVSSQLYNTALTLLSDDYTQIYHNYFGLVSTVWSESYIGSSAPLSTEINYTLQGLPYEIIYLYDGDDLYWEEMSYDGTPMVSGTPASYSGLITGRSESILRPGSSDLVRTQGFVYDDEGRLSTVLDPSAGNSSYTYDDRGNILSASLAGGSTTQSCSYSGDRLQSIVSGGSSYQFSYDSMGRMTYDGRAGATITYNRLGLPAKISGQGGSVLAKYAYLSDGMKSGAYHADGSGFIYRGSLKYARSSTGALTLVGADIPSGMLTLDGPCYTVKDHLGSVVYEVNASTGTFADGALYDEWGGREALAGVAPSTVSCRHFTGKEDQWPDFTVPYTDFGARHYSPALRRWLTPDPLSEKYYTSSPYAYCAGDPVNLVDPDGKDWYSYNKRTGDFTFIQATDDGFDTVVQLNRKGEKQLTLIENVEKGILTAGANFMNKENVLAVGNEGEPSLEGVERFVIDLSEMVGKEIGGVYYSDNGDDVITHISIGRYDKNGSHETNNYGIIALGRMFGPEHGYHYSDFITGNYHTHPLDRHYSWETRMKASPDDLKARENELINHPHLRFYILTQPPYGIKEYKYEYTYQSR